MVIVNAGDAQIPGIGSIIMGKTDVDELYRAAPQATSICSHMESVNHATLSRKELKEFLKEISMDRSVLVPDDGEGYSL